MPGFRSHNPYTHPHETIFLLVHPQGIRCISLSCAEVPCTPAGRQRNAKAMRRGPRQLEGYSVLDPLEVRHIHDENRSAA